MAFCRKSAWIPAERLDRDPWKESAMIQMPERLTARLQQGKIGYLILWALGVPIPLLFLVFLLRGCE
jgi:hypothetical protein